jgi:hypothetical protein
VVPEISRMQGRGLKTEESYTSTVPKGLRRSAGPRLLGLGVRIPPAAWLLVCECCVNQDRGLFDEVITRPYDSYRVR